MNFEAGPSSEVYLIYATFKSKGGTTSSSHGKAKLFGTPPVTSGTAKCEESEEATYNDRTREDA
jgi:hypothetical protein